MSEQPLDHTSSPTPPGRSNTSHTPHLPQSPPPFTPPPALSHPAPSSSPRVTIDHLYFPHIIDFIWSYLDYRGLVRCAKTCRAWRTRATKCLDHVTLFEFNDGTVVVRRTSIDCPGWSPVLLNAQSVKSILPKLLDAFRMVDWYYDASEELRVESNACDWPFNFTRHMRTDPEYPVGFLFGGEDPEVRKTARITTIFCEFYNGHFFLGTVPEVVTATTASLNLTVSCYSDPTKHDPLITSAHANAVMNMFPDFSVVEDATIILEDDRENGLPSDICDGQCSCCHGSIDKPAKFTLSEDTSVPLNGAFCELALLALPIRTLWTTVFVGTEQFVDVDSEEGESYLADVAEALDHEAYSRGLISLSNTIRAFSHGEYQHRIGDRYYRLQTQR